MPIYIDTHRGTELPADIRRQVETRVRSGERDAHGVSDRGVIIDKEGRQMHCILEAPDVSAVMKHHESLNMPVERGSIHQADAILR